MFSGVATVDQTQFIGINLADNCIASECVAADNVWINSLLSVARSALHYESRLALRDASVLGPHARARGKYPRFATS